MLTCWFVLLCTACLSQVIFLQTGHLSLFYRFLPSSRSFSRKLENERPDQDDCLLERSERKKVGGGWGGGSPTLCGLALGE